MSRFIKKAITLILVAGILLTPACYHNGSVDSSKAGSTSGSTPGSSSSSDQTGGAASGTVNNGDPSQQPNGSEGTVHVITNEKELDEYFNSISDEEIEKLLKIIEDVDITDDVNPEANPGFDQVEIP